MQKFFTKKNNQRGYALLFTIMIISVVSVITAGLLNASTKQLILSSLAKDSQTAFYQADTAMDCAFYADLVESLNGTFNMGSTGPWLCGEQQLNITSSYIYGNIDGSYTLSPADESVLTPCFRIVVEKNGGNTKLSAKGYNICNLSNPRAVERAIEVTY